MWTRETEAETKPVSLLDAKAQCRIEPEDTDSDTTLNLLIDTALDAIEQMVGFPLGVEIWGATFTGRGAVSVPLYPVRGLVSVMAGNEVLSGFTLVHDGDRASITGPWPSESVTVRVTVGGLVPPALIHATLLLVAQWYKFTEATSEKPLREVPFAVESLVNLYRRGWARA